MEKVTFSGAPSQWVLRFLIFLSFCSFVLGSDCYFPNGTVAKYHVECKDSSGHGQGLCCGPGTSCLENRLCQLNGAYLRGACSDAEWENPNCPDFCQDPEHAGITVFVQQCNNKKSDLGGVWGCLDEMIGIGNDSYECASDQETFTIKTERSLFVAKRMTDFKPGDDAAFDRIPDVDHRTISSRPSATPATSTEDIGPHFSTGGTITSVKGVPHSILSPTRPQTLTTTSTTSVKPPPITKAPPSSLEPMSSSAPPPPPPPKPTETTESPPDLATAPPSSSKTTVIDISLGTVTTLVTSAFIPAIPNFTSTPIPTDVFPPTSASDTQEEDDKRSIPIGVGTAFGSAIVIASGLLAFFYIRKRRKERVIRAETPPPVTEISYYEPEMGARMREPLERWRMRY